MRPPWRLGDGVAGVYSVPSTIIEAISDPRWWGAWFRYGDWAAWKSFLAALFGLPLKGEALATFRACTGRDTAPAARAREAWLVIGRRGGKSRMLALIASWLSCFCDWRPYLAPGEIGVVQILAADRAQARTTLRYLRSFITQHPILKQLVTREGQEQIELSCGVCIQVSTASFRTVRGFTLVAALADELGYWWTDEGSANPDSEIIAALRPAMATIPGAMLLCASSPYAKRGTLWDAHRRYFGQPGPILVWQAATRTMNPSVPESVIAEAYERDPASAAAEYGAEFRSDIESYIAREVIEAATAHGQFERPPLGDVDYTGFVDPSGGSADSFTLAIGHRGGDERGILDCVREVRPPFSPDSVVQDFAGLLRSYRIGTVCGDRYAGEWPRERFRVHGIDYQVAERSKSEIYRELLPILNSGRAELLDLPRLAGQLAALERRTSRGTGRDSIDHPQGQHDDVANACAGVLVAVAGEEDVLRIWDKLGEDSTVIPPPPEPLRIGLARLGWG
jgi:hypothetical protein